jgi:hypothetical protein
LTLSLAFLLPLQAGAEGFEAGFGAGGIELDDELGGETELRVDGRFGYFPTDAVEIEGQFIRATGSRFFFGNARRLAFRVELSGLGEETFGESSNHLSLTGGLTWRFGN